MITSFESKSEQTGPNAQELTAIPAVQELMAWDAGKVLRWIQQRDPNILAEEDDLNNFQKERIAGRAFLSSDVEFYATCRLPRGVGRALEVLADEVMQGGKFIPRT
jgi:hypothetical protein